MRRDLRAIWPLVAGMAAAGLATMVWRVRVRRSRLEVTPEAARFPTVSGSNLNREEVEFPRDFHADLNLLILAFRQDQQLVVNTWIPLARELEASLPDFAYYELPTIDEMPMLPRTLLNEGMRMGIPDPKARERTITLYIDTARFMSATGIANKDDVHVLLVDRQGTILWRTTGSFDEVKGRELAQAIQQFRERRGESAQSRQPVGMGVAREPV
jgi:hypothetical protein